MTQRRLYRTHANRAIAGVASGIADYFDIDPTIVRLVFILLTLAHAAGPLIYIIAWIIVPEEPIADEHTREDKTVKSEIISDRVNVSNYATTNGRLLMGLILILVGAAYFFQSILGALVWQNVWPMLLVAIGLGLIIRSLSAAKQPKKATHESSGAVDITARERNNPEEKS